MFQPVRRLDWLGLGMFYGWSHYKKGAMQCVKQLLTMRATGLSAGSGYFLILAGNTER